MEEQLTGFPHGAKWRELIPLTEAVAIVTADGLRAPTVPENKASAPKLNFGETFDREPFTELCEIFRTVNGKLVKDRRGKVIKEQEIRNEGRANAEWLTKKKLTVESSPKDWVEALLQDKRKPTDPRYVVTISEWTTYSNAKAMLSNAGQKGGIYTELTPFSPQEITSFLGLYVLHGLTPSPQVKMKFKSQLEDPVCSSDICHPVFGKNAKKRSIIF